MIDSTDYKSDVNPLLIGDSGLSPETLRALLYLMTEIAESYRIN
jgi:hypothetical protein